MVFSEKILVWGKLTRPYNSGSDPRIFFFILCIERGQYLHDNYIINSFSKEIICGAN